MIRIEKALIGSRFLVPEHKVEIGSSGYSYREAFCHALKTSARIGFYGKEGDFVVDQSLTFQYQPAFPGIADALLADTRSVEHRRYKLGALEKGVLDLHLEWPLVERFGAKCLPLKFAQMLRDHVDLPTLLIDLEGPCYEVVVPDTVPSFINQIDLEFLEMVGAPSAFA